MEENKKQLPVNEGHLVVEQAKATVKSVLDAIVELVTNSDDSFSSLEQSGMMEGNRFITVQIERMKGGVCKELAIIDNAEGMTKKELINEAIRFGGETGGRKRGKKVRGYFGRGLKESIIALGSGTILTKHEGALSGVKIWIEGKGREAYPYYRELNEEELKEMQVRYLRSKSGTAVIIGEIDKQFRIADHKTLIKQISHHFALRDINRNPDRNVNLKTISGELESKEPIVFREPEGKLILNKDILVEDEHKAHLKIFDAKTPLDSPSGNPFGLAGILIKSEGAILENTLFKYNNEPAAMYFFGAVDVPGIAKKLNEGESLVSPNRTGLDWRCSFLQKLKSEIEEELTVIVNEKKKELESNTDENVSNKNREILKKLQDLLNEFAKQEMMELETPINPGTLDSMVIKPEVTHLDVNIPKTMSIYIPIEISEVYPVENIKLEIDNELIDLDYSKMEFKPHKSYPQLLIAHFKVSGRFVGEEAFITAELGEYEAIAQVMVTTHEERKKGKKLNIKRGGFIKEIKPDTSEEPIQRVFFDSDLGEIRIYVRFPGVSNYIADGLEGIEKPEGSAILAELVIEAFCRAVAIDGIEKGRFIGLGDPVDTYNRNVSELQKKYSDKIHKLMVAWANNRGS